MRHPSRPSLLTALCTPKRRFSFSFRFRMPAVVGADFLSRVQSRDRGGPFRRSRTVPPSPRTNVIPDRVLFTRSGICFFLSAVGRGPIWTADRPFHGAARPRPPSSPNSPLADHFSTAVLSLSKISSHFV